MAGPTIHHGMAAFKCKIGFPVVKANRVKANLHARHLGNPGLFRVKFLPKFSLNFPARRCMAGRAVDFHLSAVRVLRKQIRGETQKENDRQYPVHDNFILIPFNSLDTNTLCRCVKSPLTRCVVAPLRETPLTRCAVA